MSKRIEEVSKSAYPTGWPLCKCGNPVVDGKATCGKTSCADRLAVPALARFAGSLTGIAGGTVIRGEDRPANQPSKPKTGGFTGLLTSDLFGHGTKKDKP